MLTNLRSLEREVGFPHRRFSFSVRKLACLDVFTARLDVSRLCLPVPDSEGAHSTGLRLDVFFRQLFFFVFFLFCFIFVLCLFSCPLREPEKEKEKEKDKDKDKDKNKEKDKDLSNPKSTRAKMVHRRAGGRSGIHGKSLGAENRNRSSTSIRL